MNRKFLIIILIIFFLLSPDVYLEEYYIKHSAMKVNAEEMKLKPDEANVYYNRNQWYEYYKMGDIDKLDWMNAEYIKALDTDTLALLIKEFLDKEDLEGLDELNFKKLVKLFTIRIKTLGEFKREVSYFLNDKLRPLQNPFLDN